MCAAPKTKINLSSDHLVQTLPPHLATFCKNQPGPNHQNPFLIFSWIWWRNGCIFSLSWSINKIQKTWNWKKKCVFIWASNIEVRRKNLNPFPVCFCLSGCSFSRQKAQRKLRIRFRDLPNFSKFQKPNFGVFLFSQSFNNLIIFQD
jgi:hypothetical protein